MSKIKLPGIEWKDGELEVSVSMQPDYSSNRNAIKVRLAFNEDNHCTLTAAQWSALCQFVRCSIREKESK
jgi:hypothetical protein